MHFRAPRELYFCLRQGQQTKELCFSQRRDRQPRLAEQRKVLQRFIGFDSLQADGLFESFHRRQIHGGPITFRRGWVGITFLFDPGQTDALFFVAGVIEQNQIASFHCAQLIARLEIADAGPSRFTILNEIVPRVSSGFLFHEPVIFRHG